MEFLMATQINPASPSGEVCVVLAPLPNYLGLAKSKECEFKSQAWPSPFRAVERAERCGDVFNKNISPDVDDVRAVAAVKIAPYRAPMEKRCSLSLVHSMRETRLHKGHEGGRKMLLVRAAAAP